jgi:hypothetical protein
MAASGTASGWRLSEPNNQAGRGATPGGKRSLRGRLGRSPAHRPVVQQLRWRRGQQLGDYPVECLQGQDERPTRCECQAKTRAVRCIGGRDPTTIHTGHANLYPQPVAVAGQPQRVHWLLPGPRLYRQQGDHSHQQHKDHGEEQGQPTDGIEVQSTPPGQLLALAPRARRLEGERKGVVKVHQGAAWARHAACVARIRLFPCLSSLLTGTPPVRWYQWPEWARYPASCPVGQPRSLGPA